MIKIYSYSEIVITAAIVGAEVTRSHTPHLPITPQEIAEEARRCEDAGASIVHLHVREPDGRPTQSRERFQDAIDAIRKTTDLIVQVSTGGAVGMTPDERLAPIACAPEMATLNCGSLNFGDEIFENPRPVIRLFAERLMNANVVPELEIYDLGHLETAKALARDGLVKAPFHVQFVLGIPGGAPAQPNVLRFLVSELLGPGTWSVAGVGRHEFPMAELAAELGGFVRVGIEDNVYLEKGKLAPGSFALVERAVELAKRYGRSPVSPKRARQIFGLS